MNEPLAELESVSASGRWWVPESGFVWRHDVRGQGAGPWLCLRGAADPEGYRVRRYSLVKRRSALTAFVNLAGAVDVPGQARAGMDAVLAYANEYGWLGRPTTVIDPRLDNKPRPAESYFALWHGEVRKIAALWAAKLEVERSPDPGVFKQLYEAAERELNGSQVGSSHIMVLVWQERALRFWPDSLLSALYLLFLEELLGLHAQRKMCPGCNHEFVPRRTNQLFHDEKCKARHYYRTHRRNQ